MQDMFMKIDGVDGECTDDKHQNWIEIQGFNNEFYQPASGSASTGGARSSERVTHNGLTVKKVIDKASPTLYLKCNTGEHIKSIVIEVCRATGDKTMYYKVELGDVIVSRCRINGQSEGEQLPTEDISFDYGSIKWTYVPTDHKTGKAAGNVVSGWDLVKNSKI